jgi:hypothetical protein
MLIVAADPGSATGAIAVVRHPIPNGCHKSVIRQHILGVWGWKPKGKQTMEHGSLANCVDAVNVVRALPRMPVPFLDGDDGTNACEPRHVRVEGQWQSRHGGPGGKINPKAMIGPATSAGIVLSLADPSTGYQILAPSSWRSYWGIKGGTDRCKELALIMAKSFIDRPLTSHEAEALLMALIPWGYKLEEV